MKKKLKIFLLILTVLVVGTASYLLYIFKFKQYDVADEEVQEIVAEPYTVELPDGTQITMDDKGEIVNAETPSKSTTTASAVSPGTQSDTSTPVQSDTTTTGTASDQGDKSTGTPDGNTSQAPSTGTGSANKPTVAEIKNKYAPTFNALEVQAEQKLNSLIGRAKAEYKAKKANGESIDFGYFYNKYSGAAKNLEANTDAIFHGVLTAVEKDLSANGYATEYAQSFKDEYNATKKSRRDAIISKAMGN